MNMPQIEAVTGLSRDYRTIFAKLAKGPVFLAQRSRPTAVLLSVADYEKLLDRLSRLELLAEAHRISAEMDSAPAKVTSHEELRRQLAAKVQSK